MIPNSSFFRNKNLEVHDPRDTNEIRIHCRANISIALREPSQKKRLQDPDTGWHERTPLFSSQSQHLSKLTISSRPTDNRANPRRDTIILGVSPYRRAKIWLPDEIHRIDFAEFEEKIQSELHRATATSPPEQKNKFPAKPHNEPKKTETPKLREWLDAHNIAYYTEKPYPRNSIPLSKWRERLIASGREGNRL